ncbi:MAG: beta-ketoacyl-[acyl-carrier-protein] synthase family protein [Candidatus Brocadia sp. AMX2]|uniref:3-oxoacyl-(Acyl-carrier-protein) synthase 2 n=1 Tax=Candidatus Brocadia sinica JPN1 TaxID=1197129 RepID=A0ABQ0JTM7_9BACT|nr:MULTISPECIES: beta-ketoacyl-[acyl-carrier-protein] synthase family protein [Brocadia]MBC6933978.1 beta-ketoacyl-[acyl-carrier-protein] synthase family protein [Candidatus Brocadia sp.]MBL1170658.1 beta-ketoacyl-[acyl-carrier-protein] synthase family protein [Candidatus Brocadia sp. AMX1]NOG40006.1 beta-ketoacyl-[acyl-carrier-protein] synthase family protein [Planctomycetota bacterium]GIK12893.1 MAG: 3-oxoacyl-[acyl-carrier-protein] synthase 2 [Candidatus Brocadia sinica]KAA0241465.1 MAG: be
MKKRVVITGLGVASPLGCSKEDFWNNLIAGKSGVAPMSSLDLSPYKCKLGGEIRDLKPEIHLGSKGLKYLNKGTRFLGSAAKMAIDDAKLPTDGSLSEQMGIVIGSSLGNFSETTDYFYEIIRNNPSELSPMLSYDVALNSSINYVSVIFKIKGLARTISAGFTSSTDAIADASKMIQRDMAKVIVAGGVEQISIDLYLIFYLRGLLSGLDGTREASLPFDKARNGFVMSEGSYVVILEELQHALDRGAHIYAEVKGFGNTFVGGKNHPAEVRVRRAEKAMNDALEDAGVKKGDVDLISANANGCKMQDAVEAKAIQSLFGANSNCIPLSAIKSNIGESYGTSGAAQLISSLMSINTGQIPHIINHSNKDPEINLNLVLEKSLKKEIQNAVINAMDYEGNNSCLVISKYNK